MARCEVCGRFMSDDDITLGFSMDMDAGGQTYSHFDCVVKWRHEPDRKVSYLYFACKLMGLVRDWGDVVFIHNRDPWSAYSNDGIQTYHKTEQCARRELERRSNIYR